MFQKDFRGNLFSRISFMWLDKLFIKGFRHKLVHGDLYPCPMEHCSAELNAKFEHHWQKELQKDGEPNLKIALVKTLKTPILIAAVFQTIEVLMVLIQAILLKFISSECSAAYNSTDSNYSIFPSVGYTLAISLIGFYNIINISFGSYLLYCVAMQIRAICITALFKKVLTLQQTVIHRISIGHIINLVSNDVYKFDIGILYWNFIFVAPILTLLSSIIMLVFLGPIGLVSVLILLAHAPLQTMLGFVFGHFRYLQALTTDKRICLMDQVIRGMMVIKFYVWETPLIKRISRIRWLESFYARLSGYTQSLNLTFYHTSLFSALLITYCISVALNEPIRTDQLGLAFFILNIIRYSVTNAVAQGTFSLRESSIALNRIQRVLLLQENINNRLSVIPCTMNSPGIKFDTFSASWGGTEETHSSSLVLKNINLTLDSNQLVVIAGPVGAGKSSLLLSFLNELPGLSGHLTVTGKVSYASQEPWIFSGSIRDNILFGYPFDSERYWQVIHNCCLKEDIDSFTEGDMSLIGERGVTLSGGQRARVSLARAVYHRADIYLFDDPLSAVDYRVGRDLFEKCMRGLLRGKLILLVTHHARYMEQADCIVVMREGEVVSIGSYQELVNTNIFCREFIQGLDERDKQMGLRNDIEYPSGCKIDPFVVDNSYEYVSVIDRESEKSNPVQPLSTALTTEDYRPNSISAVTYLRYFKAGGLIATIILLLLTVLSNGSLILAYWWMQSIASCSIGIMMEYTNLSNFTEQSVIVTECQPWYFRYTDSRALQLLAFLTLCGSILMFLRGINFYYVVLQASRKLHNLMLRRIMYSPIRFFDTNPSGRILNRFSKDIGFLDEQIPLVFYELWVYGSFGVTLLIANCIVQYILIIPTVLLIVSTLVLRYFFLRTSTQVKRIESIARSPLYSHISLTLQGLSTIRAMKIEEKVTRDLQYFQDEHSRTWYNYITCQRWFGIRMELLTVLLIMFSLLTASVSRCLLVSDQLINFTIPLLLTLPSIFQYVIRLSGDLDILMVSTERILNYCNLAQETSYNSSLQRCTQNSPLTGTIEYRNVCFKYSVELPYSLVNVSLKVIPGERIGIIGRTGAGKSSLLNSLFLMNEISSGSICIGGEDISSVNMYQHRKRLSIIPQSPFLFAGTLRYNLDPLEEFTPEEIWIALDMSHLKSLVESLPDQLMAGVDEDGRNFSAGERQLMCLARALLKRNDIIVIDEATSNVDKHTDLLVQQAIRTHFSKCTVLTIAHRLESIIDSDRIVVLDKASIVEDGIPALLLREKNSYLNKFILNSSD